MRSRTRPHTGSQTRLSGGLVGGAPVVGSGPDRGDPGSGPGKPGSGSDPGRRALRSAESSGRGVGRARRTGSAPGALLGGSERRSRLRAPFAPGLILLGAAGLGCAAGAFGRAPSPALLPDGAALAAAARARAGFEAAHPPYPDPALVAGVGEIGRRTVRDLLSGRRPAGPHAAAAESGEAAANGSTGVPGEGRKEDREKDREEEDWTIAVTDRSAPEAFLFADRTVFLSRGALAVLGGEAALESLFRAAALRYAEGGFRSGDGALVEQPVPLPVEQPRGASFAPEPPPDAGPSVPAAVGGNGGAGPPVGGNGGTGPAEEAGAGEARAGAAAEDAAERWVSLLDGLTLGEPPSRGGARGRDLFLPAAGLRLRAPAGFLFAPGAEGRHVGERGAGAALAVVEHPLPGSGNQPALPGESSFEAERRRVRALDLRLRRELPADRLEFVERVRRRSVVGVLARFRAAPPPAPPTAPPDFEAGPPGGGRVPGPPAEGSADGEETRAGSGRAETARFPGPGPGYRALLRTPRRLVEISFACRDRALDPRSDPPSSVPGPACENSFMEMVRSVERLPAASTPGWLRLSALPVERRQSADEALRGFVAGGHSDVPVSVLRRLNRSRLGRALAPGDRLLVARRDPTGVRTSPDAPASPEG